jgi:hypothetical protein
LKVNFFSAPYLLNVSDLNYTSNLDRVRIHIIRRMRVKAKTDAVLLVGWINPPKEIPINDSKFL